MKLRTLTNSFYCCFTLVIVIALIQSSEAKKSAYPWSQERFPNPTIDPAPFCNMPKEPGSVCDPDKQLEANQIIELNNLIDKIAKISKCPCSTCKSGEGNFQIGVAIMKQFNHSQSVNGNLEQDLRNFADYLRSQWTLGSCDNSILIAISTELAVSAISIGSKAEGILPKPAFEDLFMVNQHYLHKNNPYMAALKTLQMYHTALVKQQEKSKNGNSLEMNVLGEIDKGWEYWVSVVLLFLFVIVLVTFCVFLVLICKRRYANQDSLDKESEAANYDPESHSGAGRSHWRGLLSRELWQRASRPMEGALKKTSSEEPSVLPTSAKYSELPTGDAPSKLHQTNLDDLSDIPEMETYYDEDDNSEARLKSGSKLPRVVKV